MAQEDSRWREKYRSALNQQEQLEKTLTAQQALMHRAVLALSSAAEGQDSEMDKRLSALRTSLKGSDVGGFDRMLKSLVRVTEEAESRKQKQWSNVHKHFSTMANQLQDINPSANIKPAIKHYKKCIPKGELLPATLSRLLEEFAYIQTQALDNSPKTKSGLIGRLFKSNNEQEETIPILDNVSDTAESATW